MSLFPAAPTIPRAAPAPLAERMRPRTLDDVVGQEALLGRGRPLRTAIEEGRLPSILLWGPPGVGKTTIARLLAMRAGFRFVAFSAVSSGVKEIRECVADARAAGLRGERTIVFIDEIHRFNKAQQDALLPHVEEGLLTLVGATTENPSFEVNAALLSRCRVEVLQPIEPDAMRGILERAAADRERGLAGAVRIADDGLDALVGIAAGDARRGLNLLELAAATARADARRGEAPGGARTGGSPGPTLVDAELVRRLARSSPLLYDKAGEEHFNLASAFIKSLRAGDPDASIYWMARMLEAGEDPLFVARRMTIFASEDVGNADPRALTVALAAFDASHRVGMPEARLMLSQAALYLATAPKSNAALAAYDAAAADVHRHGALPTPLHLRNAPTGLMKEMGYGDGYVDPHGEPGAVVDGDNLPERLRGVRYYWPTDRGYEKTIRERWAAWEAERARRRRGR